MWNQSIFILCSFGREEVLFVKITLDRKLKGCCRFWLKVNQKISPKLVFAFYDKNMLSGCPIRLSLEMFT